MIWVGNIQVNATAVKKMKKDDFMKAYKSNKELGQKIWDAVKASK